METLREKIDNNINYLITEKENVFNTIKNETNIDKIKHGIEAFREAEVKQLALSWLKEEFGL